MGQQDPVVMGGASAGRRWCAVALCCAACLAPLARGQQVAGAGLPLWELGIGAGALAAPAYPASDQRSSRALALPFVIYRGEILRADRSGVSARMLHNDRVEFDVGFAAALAPRAGAVRAREGMPDLGTLGEFGPRVKLQVAQWPGRSRLRLELPLRAVIELRGGVRRQGWTVEPRLLYETGGDADLWDVDAYLGLVAGDAAINRYYYEVQPVFATPGRAAYAARSGLMLVRASVSGSRKVNPDLRLFGYLRYESYANSANRDSPLFRKNSGASAGIGILWTFKKS